MMAIISKAVFEKAAGKSPALGTRLQMDRYVSANKNLEPLAAGGKLYLVTVRPPDESLWLVAVLNQPRSDGTQWLAAAAAPTPLTDITALRSQLRFESGAGITAKPGALGMSLQTPRALTAADVALLDRAAGGEAFAGEGIPAAPTGPSSIGAVTGARRDVLLGAILEHPESDEARQVYADQLIANNDPRGELILLDIALAGPLSIRQREQLAGRRLELIAAHATTWWPYVVSHSRTSRGFVEAVSGTLEQLRAVAPALFAAEPVTEVTVLSLDGDDEELDALLAAKWLPRVRHLIVRGMLGSDGFARLCKAKPLARLEALNVCATELDADALAGMKGGLPRCTHLVLTGNALGDEGMTGLRGWKALESVTTLYLSGCELTSEGIETLLAKPLPRLTKLCLTGNELGDEGAVAIAAQAARLPALQHLEVRNIALGMSGLRALAAAPLPALRRVDARKNQLPELAPRDARVRVD
ncbi:MAG: TIGR02996 domain-containing protein [Myxococcota bacterium]|nr:TIGR02996 domain-containing protein [Myxococcota bacterium]